jgi:hypothetical protein
MMSGHEPAGMPSTPKKSLREWAGAACREMRQHKIATGVTVAGLALAVAATMTGAPARGRGPGPRVPGFTLPVLGHPGEHVSLAAYAGRPGQQPRQQPAPQRPR